MGHKVNPVGLRIGINRTWADALGTVAPEGEDEEGSEVFQQRSLGSGVGLEVFLRRNLARKLGGFVSYTLSRSWRSVGRESFPSNFDRTHVLNLALGYGFGRGYRVGGRVVFYTGTPTQPEPVGPIQPLRSEHPERSKPFYRLDLRFEKKWMLGGRSFLSFVAEVMNTTLSKETFGDEEVGPITVPSIGVEGGF